MITIKLTDHEAWTLTEILSRVLDDYNFLKDNELNEGAENLYDKVMEERTK